MQVSYTFGISSHIADLGVSQQKLQTNHLTARSYKYSHRRGKGSLELPTVTAPSSRIATLLCDDVTFPTYLRNDTYFRLGKNLDKSILALHFLSLAQIHLVVTLDHGIFSYLHWTQRTVYSP